MFHVLNSLRDDGGTCQLGVYITSKILDMVGVLQICFEFASSFTS